MSLDREVLAELRAQSTKREEAPLRDRANALESRLNRIESALSNCVRYDEQFGKTIAMLLKESGLSKRIKELESRPAIKYMGVHKPGAEYSEGSLITRDGSLFHANRTTRATPGDGSQDYTLCVKRGRDGKDSK